MSSGNLVWIFLPCLVWDLRLCLCQNAVGFAALRLYRNQMEVSSKSLAVRAGSEFTVTCDGSALARGIDPHLRWYGPDKHWIAYEGPHNRVHVEYSQSRWYLRLHIRRLSPADAGMYYCRGWLGQGNRWDLRSIRLVVVSPLAKSTTRVDSRPSISTLVTMATQTSSPPPPPAPRRLTTAVTSRVLATTAYLSTASPEPSTCADDMLVCRNGVGCVPMAHICDGVFHCSDGSDEDPIVC